MEELMNEGKFVSGAGDPGRDPFLPRPLQSSPTHDRIDQGHQHRFGVHLDVVIAYFLGDLLVQAEDVDFVREEGGLRSQRRDGRRDASVTRPGSSTLQSREASNKQLARSPLPSPLPYRLRRMTAAHEHCSGAFRFWT